jgi:hypothetical protein
LVGGADKAHASHATSHSNTQIPPTLTLMYAYLTLCNNTPLKLAWEIYIYTHTHVIHIINQKKIRDLYQNLTLC